MADILEVATREFAEKGLAGARIDVIAEAMRTSKRMIYYYFGSKEGLYVAVLEEAYRRMRGSSPSEPHLEDLAPEEALRKLVAFTVDYQLAHPEFIRLVMTRTSTAASTWRAKPGHPQLNVPAIEGAAGGATSGACGGRVPRRHRRGRPAHVDQRAQRSSTWPTATPSR
jgi:AcrR family transcriptional regulator